MDLPDRGRAPSHPRWRWLALFLAFTLSSNAIGQDDAEGLPRQGGLARLELSDGRVEYAVDAAPRFGRTSPPRAAAVTWTGELTLPEEGTYHFAAEFRGRLLWKLGEQTLIDETTGELAVRSAALTIAEAKGLPLRIEFTPASEDGALRTFWSGPKFLPEPLSEAHLNLGPIPSDAEAAPTALVARAWPVFRRGEAILERSRCASCHDHGGEASPPPASDLAARGRWLKPEWIAQRLRSATPAPHVAMPAFALDEAEAGALAAALGAKPSLPTDTSNLDTSKLDSSSRGESALDAAQAAKAEALLTTSGCLACHSWKEIGSDQASLGGDLTQIGDKWTPDFFEKWLANPKEVDPHAQMPRPALSEQEIKDLAALLASSKGVAPAAASARPASARPASPRAASPRAEPPSAAEVDVKSLAASRRCGVCHVLPPSLKSETPPRHKIEASFDTACLAEPTDRHPGYAFSSEDRQALEAVLRSYHSESTEPKLERGQRSPLEKQGCTQCHARGAEGGLREKLLEIAAEEPERFPKLAEMTPPSLNSVGDKLHERALRDAIARTPKTKKERPWLEIRMPYYGLSDTELQALGAQLVWEDRVPEAVWKVLHTPPSTAVSDAELRSAGARLVTTDGFSCTSCHDIGAWKASPAKPAARGTDLAMCGQRLRQEWFLRWLRNPARITPNMEMPSVQVPVKGVLGGDLEMQSQALWRVMNQPGFTPPSSAALRVLAGGPGGRLPIAYLMDVVTAEGKTHIKPLVIALPNQVNLLWDMKENRLSRFWIGEAARQYTRGKSWYWHAEGMSLLGLRDGAPELVLRRGEKSYSCAPSGQFKTEIDALQLDANQLSIRHRAHYPLEGGETRLLTFTQTFRPLSPKGDAPPTWGFSREIAVEGLQEGESVQFVETREHFRPDGAKDFILAAQEGDRRAVYHYLTTEPPPAAPASTPYPQSAASSVDHRLVPGFATRRLALPVEIMPTAIAWRPDGAMGVASLRGRIWQVQDLDRDGVEESALPFTDEFAAPYGLAGHAEGYDILAKGGLYRARDGDGDGVAEDLRLLASGWGHTDDYHDWAVGLPSDGRGGYYVALPCQQDDRSPAAAHHRGKLLHLSPREATPDDPRAMAIEIVSSGHRFPMGLARRASDGALFVSDNQGNYNPFNELNHAAPGKFFGFINQLEKRAKFAPPPLEPPAINLPHPWTRSVNGVCFLDGPAGKSFGPFEGHLVGCEYDTRRLVRMSLQKIGDRFQGAVYPLSREAAPEGLSFLGPVSCAVSPRGELYVGSMKDSGWGAGNNIGEVFQLQFDPARLPAGITEVAAAGADALAIQFHGAIDAAAARNAASYRIESYTRVSTPAYGGEDRNRRRETIEMVAFDEQRRRATLKLPKLRPGFVYEIHIARELAASGDFFPAEAYFTFHQAP